MTLKRRLLVSLSVLLVVLAASFAVNAQSDDNSKIIKVLFWGGTTGHQPQERLRDIATEMLDRGIHLVYVHGDLSFLTLEHLSQYDVVLFYGNWDFVDEQYANAVVEYVEKGGGVVAIHSASFMFRNTDFIPLVGGQFQRHPAIQPITGRVVSDHPVIAGWEPFVSEDEPYIHNRHNEENRIVLEVSASAPNLNEPYTWIRTQGEGRVFYTAWGHDQRTWTNPGFHDLIERGIIWAAGLDVQERLANRQISNPFLWKEALAPIPIYPNHQTNRSYEMPVALWAEESMNRIIVPAGFEVTLYAADPFVSKVIDFNWDEQGRMWILETPDYPYHMTDPSTWPSGRDKLVILEDTDGDGKADKRTVWADGLNIVQSFAFWGNGVVLAQQPYLFYLEDTDGDGKADYREIIVTGLASTGGSNPRGDTHAGPSNLRYGFDNLLWGTCGYSCGGNPWNQSIWRFNPDEATGQNRSQVFQHMANTPCNTWGLGFSEEGIVFASTATCGAPSLHLAIPAYYYDRVAGLNTPTLASISGNVFALHIDRFHRQVENQNWHRFTAAASHELYTARAFPEYYWNRVAFVNEPTTGSTGQFFLTPSGASFTSHNPQSLLMSDDSWVSPINAKVGPDGAVWVLDWYNIIIQHNPTPFGFTAINNAYVTPNRENEYARIYRIAWKDAPEYQPINLANASVTDLVNTLKNDNMFWRLTAQRLLVQQNLWGAIPALVELVKDQSVDAIGLNPGAIHALWTLHGLGAITEDNPTVFNAVVDALKHPSAGVRRNAVLVLPQTDAARDAILAAGLLRDEEPQVVLATLLALADMPASNEAGAAIFNELKDSELLSDRWIRDAMTIAAVTHKDGFLAAAEAVEAAAGEVEVRYGPNLIANGDFEQLGPNGLPVGWSTHVWGGQAQHAVVEGRNGGHAVAITGLGNGTDAHWEYSVVLEPGARYHLAGWIKTEGLAGAKGATISIHEMQDVDGTKGSRTGDFHGTNDWTYRETVFTAEVSNATVLTLLGGWGNTRGTAIWDDITLRKIETDAGDFGPILQVIDIVKRQP